MKQLGTVVLALVMGLSVLVLPVGAERDARAYLVTGGESYGEDYGYDGPLYISTSGLTFYLNLEGNTGSRALFHYSPVDSSGNWYDVTTREIPLKVYWGGSWYNQSGSVEVTGIDPARRYEFVVEEIHPDGSRTWLKPWHIDWNVGAGRSGFSYDLGPDYLNPGSLVTFFNGHFFPLETPYVAIDFPQEDEVVNWPSYVMRLWANESTNSVNVSVDGGPWNPARWDEALGYFWFDWSGYSQGPHEIVAESWNELGQRTETSVRNVTVDY